MKRAQRQILLSLAFSAVAAFVLALLLQQRAVQQHEQKQNQPGATALRQHLFDLEEVAKLELLRDGVTTSIFHEKSVWKMRSGKATQPALPVHPLMLARVLADLGDAQFVRVLFELDPTQQGKQAELKNMGLARPRLRWIARLKDKKSIRLSVGKNNPLSGMVYIETQRRDGTRKIGLVKSHELSGLDIDAFRLRDRRLLHIADAKIARLIFMLEDNKDFALLHDGPKTQPWRSEAALPAQKDLKQEAVEAALQMLRRVQWTQKWSLADDDSALQKLNIDWDQARGLRLLDLQQKVLAELRISPLQQGQSYLWRQDKKMLYRVEDRALDQWPHLQTDLLSDAQSAVK